MNAIRRVLASALLNSPEVRTDYLMETFPVGSKLEGWTVKIIKLEQSQTRLTLEDGRESLVFEISVKQTTVSYFPGYGLPALGDSRITGHLACYRARGSTPHSPEELVRWITTTAGESRQRMLKRMRGPALRTWREVCDWVRDHIGHTFYEDEGGEYDTFGIIPGLYMTNAYDSIRFENDKDLWCSLAFPIYTGDIKRVVELLRPY